MRHLPKRGVRVKHLGDEWIVANVLQSGVDIHGDVRGPAEFDVRESVSWRTSDEIASLSCELAALGAAGAPDVERCHVRLGLVVLVATGVSVVSFLWATK